MQPGANKLLLSSIRRYLRAGRSQQFDRLINKTHPADLAHLFGVLSREQQQAVFQALSSIETRGELISELETDVVEGFLDSLSDEELTRLVDVMPSDDATDLIQLLPAYRRDLLIELMTAEEQSEATSLMGYDEESAGGLMATDFLALLEDTTTEEAVRQIQAADEAEIIFYIYVVNDLDQLVGVLSLRELVRQRPSRPVREFMIRDVIRVAVDDDQEDVARLVARYNLLALPVVESDNTLVGVVTVDDIIDVIRIEATEDILLMAGAGDEQELSAHRSPLSSARSRLPWLFPSFFAGAVGVLVVSLFEESLAQLIPLAALIPMIMGIAGNIGNQSSTIIIRGLALGRVDLASTGKLIGRELIVGLLCGAFFGVIAGLFSTVFFSGVGHLPDPVVPFRFGAVVAVSVLAATTLASLIGAGVPLFFRKMGLDPAMATGPFIITSIDVSAVLIYLTFATYLLF